MKQRLFILLAYVLLATAVVTLDLQLRYMQMEFQATADETKVLFFVFSHSRDHVRPAAQEISQPKANMNAR